MSEVRDETEVSRVPPGLALIDGEAVMDSASALLSGPIRSNMLSTVSGRVVFATDELPNLEVGSEIRGLFKGVDSAARPSQRPERFKGRVLVEDGMSRADVGFGK